MKELQERIEKMLEGEKKRRGVALRFVEGFEEILEPIACEIWNTGTKEDKEIEPNNTALWVWRMKDQKKRLTDLYYRYERWYGKYDEESPGFYLVGKYNEAAQVIPIWGEALENIKGKDFWYCIQLLIEWIPELTKLIDKKDNSRNELVKLLAK
jgi:hypothetical protein